MEEAVQRKIEKTIIQNQITEIKQKPLDVFSFVLLSSEIERLNNVNAKYVNEANIWKKRFFDMQE